MVRTVDEVRTTPRVARGPAGVDIPVAWLVTVVLVAGALLHSLRLDRYLEWDEAVFFSQSGGLEGSGAGPSVMVASREIGPPRLIGVLRTIGGDGLSDTRLLWVLVGLALLVVGSWAVGRVARTPGWVILGLFGTFWLAQLFLGGFWGFAIGAALALCVIAAYLHLRAGEADQRTLGLLFGLAVAAVLWMRQVEGAVLVACIVVHALVVTPRAFWRSRWKGAGIAVVVAVITFAVPWVVDSTVRFGSVLARISSGRGQDYERGWTNNLGEYLSVVRGRSVYYSRAGTPPRWALYAVDALLVIFVLVVCVSLVIWWRNRRPSARTSADQPRVGAVGLCLGAAAVLVGLFVFFIGEVSDRYMLMGLAPATVVLAVGLQRLVERRWSGRRATLVLAATVVLWGTVNTAVAVTYETGRALSSAHLHRTAHTLRTLAEDAPCQGITRYGQPPLQLVSGCQVSSGTKLEAAMTDVVERAREHPDALVFLLWPLGEIGPDDVPEGWSRIDRPNPTGANLSLLYRSPS